MSHFSTTIYHRSVCLISYFPVGGFRSFLENISQCLIRNGYQVTILSLNEEQSIKISGTNQRFYELEKHIKKDEIEKKSRKNGIIEKVLYRLKRSHTERDALRHGLYHSQLKAICKAQSCEIIDLSEYDCVISCEEVQCNYILAYSVIAKRKIGYIHPDYQNVPYNKRIDKAALRRLDYICATSEANAESIRYAYPSLKNRIIGVPNPIDVKTVLRKAEAPIEEIFSTDVVNLITVCRLDNTYKALDRLLSVSKKLKRNGVGFIWRVIGDGDYENVMRIYIQKNDLQDCVIMLGAKNNPIPYVKQSDLFVLQSYSEGYPMSVLEALAVDTPVLVTDYPSSREQVDEGVTGYIVHNDYESVFDKLYDIIENRDMISRLHNNLKRMDKSKLEYIENLLEILRK